MISFSTEYVLLKSYAVPSATQLLVSTRQLSCPMNISKRAEDTCLVLSEILINGMDSERGSKALAKMNWLHQRYGPKVLNRDMIYTLCLFVLEPIHWIEKYEWRPMSETEKVGFFVYWREIAGRMEIKDIPATLDELEHWNDDFSSKYLYYAKSNRIVADATLEVFSSSLPEQGEPMLMSVAAALLDARTRVALGWKSPHWMYPIIIHVFFRIRALVIKYLWRPRHYPAYELTEPDEKGRIYRSHYNFDPLYMSEARWKILIETSWHPSRRGNGYVPEELGPEKYEKKSKKVVLEEAAQMREYGRLGGMSGLGCRFRFNAKS